ncbi:MULTISPECIES: MerR family transcriptional regulator [Methylobacterium]|jgi:DNA-binding transcriptional MerR regulator|uniref:HTH-type transcriptional regulator HmrR n=2 Tax=Methylobacterium TaxID=407 RepID=A0AA37M5U4_9HYPH|nr:MULTISPECIES: helix-turn-helix domain-containing protein [Methylobacterium]PIK72347.1 MerR family transcriptional regulator [Methylobacterium frigidaeris]TGD97912.1 MerR family transcriptional regulator [Methylobacterium nonmethylotrophicum]GJD63414.1 HTH-type transcriptional regulator HmrR [Methylobacterium frigidaeris]
MRPIAIGELSRRTAVKVTTIRFYEERGLLPTPERTEGNRRSYGEADVRRLRFIRHARELGFEIEDIQALLDLAGQPDRPCGEADAIARKHLADIDDRIARLTGLRQEVQAMVEQCSGGHVRECRIIEVLADHGECLHERH